MLVCVCVRESSKKLEIAINLGVHAQSVYRLEGLDHDGYVRGTYLLEYLREKKGLCIGIFCGRKHLLHFFSCNP